MRCFSPLGAVFLLAFSGGLAELYALRPAWETNDGNAHDKEDLSVHEQDQGAIGNQPFTQGWHGVLRAGAFHFWGELSILSGTQWSRRMRPG